MTYQAAGRLQRNSLLSYSLAAVLLVGLAPATALGIAAAALHANRDLSLVLTLMAVITPVVLVQDLLRYVAIAQGRPGVALASDAVWLAVAAAGLIVLTSRDESGAWMGAMLWCVGALVGLAIVVGISRPRGPKFRGLPSWMMSDVRRGHLAADAALAGTSPLINSTLAGIIAGTHVIGAVRGAGTLFGPLNALTSTVVISAVPEAKTLAREGASKLFDVLAMVLIVVTLGWGSAAALLPETIGSQLLGQTWELAHPLIVFTTLEYCGLSIWAAATARLRYMDATDTALRHRIGHAIALVTVPPIAVAKFQSALAFSASLAAIGMAVGIYSHMVSKRLVRMGS